MGDPHSLDERIQQFLSLLHSEQSSRAIALRIVKAVAVSPGFTSLQCSGIETGAPA